jgi:signal transduction histidine kinase
MSAAPEIEQRLLLKTLTSRDAAGAVDVLARADMCAQAFRDVAELVREMERGAAALLLAEEVLVDPAIETLATRLRSQPAWSDLPILVLARPGANSTAVDSAMARLGNVTVIERPIRVAAFVSSVRAALRARQRQYELRAVIENLRVADQRKTEFLATLAHELRNPLAPLGTALSILTRQQLDPPKAKPYLDMMGRQIDHMVRLINDLMEVSRITRGKIELRTETLPLDRVVRDAIELSRPLLDAAGHQLDVEIAPGDWLVRGDGVRLSQVFANLLNNAAKYTPPGGHVRVAVERAGSRARVRVSDDGLGIPAEMLPSIFGMFVQVSDTSRTAQGGLGIGLTLVKSLVELHGGTVSASSAGLGLGTEFVVELPLAHAGITAATARVQQPALPAITGTVLIVDDNRDAADTLSDLLQLSGATTFVAYDGMEALVTAASERPQLAILDIGMPGMDGCELARTLRADPAHAGMVLVALTGWGQQDDRRRIADAGFDLHFLKPIDIAELSVAVRRLHSPA